jgi:hypothetical protein
VEVAPEIDAALADIQVEALAEMLGVDILVGPSS